VELAGGRVIELEIGGGPTELFVGGETELDSIEVVVDDVEGSETEVGTDSVDSAVDGLVGRLLLDSVDAVVATVDTVEGPSLVVGVD
jgi:hypothetical protein